MHGITKLLLVVLALIVTPLKQWAQTPYRQYSNNGVELNFSNIDDVYFRAYLLYNLSQDDRFILTAEEDNSVFYIGSSVESLDEGFFDTFDDIYNLSYTDFQMLSKLEITDLYPVWKSQVNPRYFTSMMMDITLRNSREGENETCLYASPFCTSDFYEFEIASTNQSADDLEPYTIEDGCIMNSINPSWYYMRIADAGQFVIHIEGHDPYSKSIIRDIDFCIWGPYTEEELNSGYACSHLTGDMIIDCSYSASNTEDVYLGYPEGEHVHATSHGTVNYHVPQTGEYYLLMVTNSSCQPCTISFQNVENSGSGSTDPNLLPPLVSNDGPYFVGETIHLFGPSISGASYSWIGPNNYRSRYQNPNRSNCTMAMAGAYVCTITLYDSSVTDTTWVVVYPQPAVFLTDGNWNDASKWSTGEVPASGSNVRIEANAIIPADYSVIANQVIIADGGSLTIADGGQLKHNTNGLVVTMKKNIEAYTGMNCEDNYYLLSFPFETPIAVPDAMTAVEGYDLYGFDPNYLNAEWRNNRQQAITTVGGGGTTGYLYAIPEDMELSLTGVVATSHSDSSYIDEKDVTIPYTQGSSKPSNGWALLGNPFTCDAYLYDDENVPMDFMVYNEQGELVICNCGPIPPMQGFFVKVNHATTARIMCGPRGCFRIQQNDLQNWDFGSISLNNNVVLVKENDDEEGVSDVLILMHQTGDTLSFTYQNDTLTDFYYNSYHFMVCEMDTMLLFTTIDGNMVVSYAIPSYDLIAKGNSKDGVSTLIGFTKQIIDGIFNANSEINMLVDIENGDRESLIHDLGEMLIEGFLEFDGPIGTGVVFGYELYKFYINNLHNKAIRFHLGNATCLIQSIQQNESENTIDVTVSVINGEDIPNNFIWKNYWGQQVTSPNNVYFGVICRAGSYYPTLYKYDYYQKELLEPHASITQTFSFPVMAVEKILFRPFLGFKYEYHNTSLQNGYKKASLARYGNVEAFYPEFEIITVASPTEGGTVTEGGRYNFNTQVTLTATANSGYEFTHWEDGSESNPRTITVEGDATYTAYFEGPLFDINVLASPSVGGTVGGSGRYPANTTIITTATASSGYEFTHWEDGSTSNPRVITVEGDATYTAYFEEQPDPSGDWVDLGLPSGLLWATRNVGASSPEDYGDYFAWGETSPKSMYNWDTYIYYNSQTGLTKYTGSDGLTILQPGDDAATANYGGRMPTLEEWQELRGHCAYTWATVNGVGGWLFTGPNGRTLFLPAAGFRWDDELTYAGDDGYYWSSSHYTYYPYRAWYLYFNSDDCYFDNYGSDRYFGLSVRPVRSARQN